MTEVIKTILAVGPFVPVLVALVLQSHWSKNVRTAVTLGVTVLAGLVAWVTENGLDFSSPSAVVATVVGVVLASATAYKMLWKSTGITDAIEAKTSATPAPAYVPRRALDPTDPDTLEDDPDEDLK